MSKTVAERLTELRDKMGYTQKEIAITLKVSGPTVSQWESGIKVPKNKNLERLADLYGVSTDYLMGRTEETNLAPPFDSGTALHTARLANNMTPQDIAIIANVGPATVKAWEANRPKAPREKLALIAGALNLPVEELAGPQSAPTPQNAIPYTPARAMVKVIGSVRCGAGGLAVEIKRKL